MNGILNHGERLPRVSTQNGFYGKNISFVKFTFPTTTTKKKEVINVFCKESEKPLNCIINQIWCEFVTIMQKPEVPKRVLINIIKW